MTLRISRQQQQQLLHWAAETGGDECCGLIWGKHDGYIFLERTENVAAEPDSHFEIEPAALIAAERAVRNRKADWIGYFHSHPNGLARPSSTDAELAADDGRFWLIIASAQITAWRTVPQSPVSERFEPVELIIEG